MPKLEVCDGCRSGGPFPVAFTMAFQPIVDVASGAIWAHEALVRGVNGENAYSILSRVTAENRYKFDQACRVRAIELAGQRMSNASNAKLSINFMPNAVYEPSACIRASLAAAKRVGFDPSRLMFEFTENERMEDTSHVGRIIETYREMGFTTAVDDFGAGYAGLGLLARFKPDVIKIDMELIRGIDSSYEKAAIVRGIVSITSELGVTPLAEGIETEAEARILMQAGIRLQQGYYYGRPVIETFSESVTLPRVA